ncbi:hypothetical protein P167DRAFT_533635 [Morchella conica CCBAS932]|uniref:Uncharacterized protein n=1 Tax=Morchella conica CCBAS932 TaxID=1392247 RepID=A0A3N4L355_9PEZI|nr:hypothetical protein P167DRAFT_533635 [Morchella conica CCBAS932]
MSNISEPAVAADSSHTPFEIHLAADWGIVDIKEWLFNATRGEHQILWDKFFENHFKVSKPGPEESGEAGLPDGISLRLKPGPVNYNGMDILDPIEFTMTIYGHEMTVKMYSSWDALAVILNCKLPRYDPTTGPAKGYALNINVLFAKWSKLMSGCLAPNKFYPPVYCVFYTETSQRNIFLLSVGKVVDLKTGTPDLEYIRTRVVEMLVDARRNQLYQALPGNPDLFDTDDNPLKILLKPDGRLPDPDDLEARGKKICASSGKPVTEKTWNEFCTKYKRSNVSCKNLVGACAEAWGFQLMLQILHNRPGDCYYSIALGQGKHLNSIKLGPRYRYSRSNSSTSKITKGICDTCCLVACAIKAKYNITLNEITDANIADILDTANSNPVSTTPQDDGPAKGDQEVLTKLPRKRENETTETEPRGTPRRRGGLLGYISSKLARQTNGEEANN